MCGIAGIFGERDEEVLGRMLATITHRGPDDGHQIGGRGFCIGGRRLSIMDLEHGRQPLTDLSGEIVAAQNGEIYNFPSLREDLIRRGAQLRTACDTEVIPYVYREFGVDGVKRLDGMFAVALWDTRNDIGLLARDRMGKKPLYYFERDDVVYFASEIKALLKVPGFHREINPEALTHYLSYKHVPHPLSIFRGIRQVPPAHFMVFERGKPLHLERYWKPDFSPRNRLSEEEACDRFLELFQGAVRRRMMADVPVGFFLSGGIDSSLTAAVAAEGVTAPIKTFTLTYDQDSGSAGKEQDRRWAAWVAKTWGTDHLEENIHAGQLPDLLPKVMRCFDEPFAGVISTYQLSRAIARHVKTAVAGDGADELFGSYLSHRAAEPLANYPAYVQTSDASLIPGFESNPEFLAQLYAEEPWHWRSKLFVFTETEKQSLLSEQWRDAVDRFSSVDHLHAAFRGGTAADPLNRILEAEFQGIFPDQVLTFVDRLSMAHSLEVRSAFLDTAVVEFVASLPGSMKIHRGRTKDLLKKVASRFFPQAMIDRPKEGFLMPVTQWMLRDLRGFVEETLSPERIALHGIFDSSAVNRLLSSAQKADLTDYRTANRLYTLICFQFWFEDVFASN